MASTRIEDLPDNLEESSHFDQNDDIFDELDFIINNKGNVKGNVKDIQIGTFFNYSLIKDTLLVLILLLFSTNNEIQRGLIRFPGLKLQRNEIAFSVLISILFAIIYASIKIFLF